MTRVQAGAFEVDDDPGRVDADAAIAFLTTSASWARWRTAADIKEQISQASRVVGGYDATGAMVGFARAFGDGATCYLTDVYVLPPCRGAGLGTALVRLMIEGGPLAGARWMLHTSGAHGLYRRFGFAAPDSRYLERPRPAVAGHGAAGRGAAADPLETGVLTGDSVRLEPLGYQHLDGLVRASAGGASAGGASAGGAAAGGGDLYRWSAVPRGTSAVSSYIEAALAARDRGVAVPYAVRRLADGVVAGSTRFFDIAWWSWPDGRRPLPDSCEIGYTWLSAGAVRTAANTEMKRLMLTWAFETWQVELVCLHTDARNDRSRAAMERFGARFEGILRAHRPAADGGPRDSARYSVTAADWPRVRERFAELARRYG